MEKRLLLMGAGGGPGNNLIRSLKIGDPSLVVVGCHTDRFVLKNSPAERNYLVHAPTHPGFLRALRRVIAAERIDLLIPNTDTDVAVVADLRDEIPCRTFLPRSRVIALCQDKYELTTFLRARGVPAPLTCPVSRLDDIEDIFRRLAPHTRLWCRMRRGQGALGGLLVRTPEQARSWIKYWEEMRSVPPAEFTLSEYLPGRDFACQAVWNEGQLVLVKSYERLSYLGSGGHPSGVSSLAALSRTVGVGAIVEASTAAVRAIDPEASGVFCFDLRENAGGDPCITEINAGRFGLSTNIFDVPGKHNTAVAYVRLALGEPVEIREEYDVTDDYYMVRDYDTLSPVRHADEFFEGIEDARC